MGGDEEKITRALRRIGGRARTAADRSNCPSEEVLSKFLSGDLIGTALSELESHLANCSFCVEELVAAHQSTGMVNLGSVPQQLTARAMALISGRESLFDLAVRLIKGSIELISTSGRVVLTPMPAVRGEAKPALANALQVEQEVGRFRVAVELDLSEAGICQVVANVKDESGAPAEGVRLSLSSGEREQASFLTRNGVVVFDRIAPGEYSIAVSESGNAVGKIRLNLMLER